MSQPQPTVLVLGATGNTGKSIIDGLLDYGKAKVIAVVRESSVSKPSVQAYRSRGASIRTFDLDHFTPSDAEKLFEGIDVVLAAFQITHLHIENALIDAAKKVGVKRFVPCDWSTATVKGVREMFDLKLAVREYLQKSGVGYTFVDVGWWMQGLLPPYSRESSLFPDYPQMAEWVRNKYGSYETRTAVTDLADVGKFVARIVDDQRTLGQYVFCWGDEVTQAEVVKIVEELCPIKIEFVHHDEEDILRTIAKAKADGDLFSVSNWEYNYSLWVREDNLVEKAKLKEYGGALDARELYPDFEPKSFRRVAEEFYRST